MQNTLHTLNTQILCVEEYESVTGRCLHYDCGIALLHGVVVLTVKIVNKSRIFTESFGGIDTKQWISRF